VFAFGVLLYEYACGTHPFEAATPLGVAARVLESDARPLETRCPDLPRGVTAIIERCLRKTPADRYASAAELVRALDDVQGSPGSRASSRLERSRGAEGSDPAGGSPARWWRTHQIVIVVLYAVATTAGWQIKEWLGGPPTYLFVAMGIAATTGGVFRGHLLFTERVNRPHLTAERGRADKVTAIVDVIMAVALASDGLMLIGAEPLTAVLLFALAVGMVLARFVLERATTTAAFGD
jgi:hypothetical protein